MSRFGIVVGLPQEAAILEQVLGAAVPSIRCAGAQPARAAAAARELMAEGAEILLSFGYAGGLDPSLRSGDIVIADRVTASDGTSHPTDKALRDLLSAKLEGEGCSGGAIAGVERALASVEDKRATAARTGAVAVDMESHAVAAAGCPFIVLRVIVDPAHRALPLSVLDALDDKGRVRPVTMVANLLRSPADFPRLLALSRGHAAARRSLRRAAAGLGVVLGLV